MIKVVHVGYNHRYDDVRILRKECRTLQYSGLYEVTYVTSDKNGETTEDVLYGVNLKIIHINKNLSRVKRIKEYYSRLKKELINIDADIYHIHEPILLPMISFLKKNNKKVIYDKHEDTVKDLSDFAAKYNKIIGKLLGCAIGIYERKMIDKADGFIFVTPQFAVHTKKERREMLIPNYPQKSETVRAVSLKEYKSRANIVCFAGGISDTWSQINILNALDIIDDVQYYLAGRCTNDYMGRMEKERGWQKVLYYGLISFDEVKNMIYLKARIGLALLGYVLSDKRGTLGNTKIYEFMQAGLPVICTDFNLWRDIVEKYNCGILVNPDNIEEIKEAIEYLLSNEEEAYRMGQNGKMAIEKEYNWEKSSRSLLHLYENILQ